MACDKSEPAARITQNKNMQQWKQPPELQIDTHVQVWAGGDHRTVSTGSGTDWIGSEQLTGSKIRLNRSEDVAAAAPPLPPPHTYIYIYGTVSSKTTLVILFQIFQDKQKKSNASIEMYG